MNEPAKDKPAIIITEDDLRAISRHGTRWIFFVVSAIFAPFLLIEILYVISVLASR